MSRIVISGCFLAFILCILSSPTMAARYVPIKVFLDGKLILEGNASDNGHPDADEVWDALKSVNLGETDAFKEMFGSQTRDDFTILKKRSQNEEPLKITIEVAYGGVAETTGLRVIRMKPDSAGRTWRIHPDEVSSLFNSRMIKRSDVPRLNHPKRSQ